MNISKTIDRDYGYAEGFQPGICCNPLVIQFEDDGPEVTRISQGNQQIEITRYQLSRILTILNKIDES